MKNDRILLSHGSGGRLSHQLVKDMFLPVFQNPRLGPLDDGAIFKLNSPDMVLTTDSYVVNPIFFPGGDIGKLAVAGTVNDLSVMGAAPRYLSLSCIMEEGLPMADLEKILKSIRQTCEEAKVEIITGDTKVVPAGMADKIFINTTGIGELWADFKMTRKIQSGDKIILNGTIGDHGTAIMAKRDGLNLQSPLTSDCAPLNHLIAGLIPVAKSIRIMRDATRGGVATVLNELVENTDLGIFLEEASIPVRGEVRGVCEILGLDPLYIANEGKVVIAAEPEVAGEIVSLLKAHPLGKQACIIGEVTDQQPQKVVLKTQFGTRRIVDMLTGEQLPRIC